jgi:sugar transferase (PEP-CTERM/EpsH1 system associated)
MPAPIHVTHLVYQFAAGGLENVITQLINGLPADRFRHSVIAVSSVDPVYRQRVTRTDVTWNSLHKGPGQPFRLYPKMLGLLKSLRPDVLHSCNLAALDFVPVAALAGVRRRIHAEHGWSVEDPGGKSRKNQWIRRFYRPWISEYAAVSGEIADYLNGPIGVPRRRIHLIENGVDLARFHPHPRRHPDRNPLPLPDGMPFDCDRHCIVGTVGRLEPVKNQALLLDAMALALATHPALRERLRLVMVGDGPLRSALAEQITRLGLTDQVWLAGTRHDVPDLLRAMDVFVLCSFAEGTSCAVQEALATGLDVIATEVGGNRRLLGDGAFGQLVDSGNIAQLAQALVQAALSTQNQTQMPAASLPSTERNRAHAAREFSLDAALQRYDRLFSGGSDSRA